MLQQNRLVLLLLKTLHQILASVFALWAPKYRSPENDRYHCELAVPDGDSFDFAFLNKQRGYGAGTYLRKYQTLAKKHSLARRSGFRPDSNREPTDYKSVALPIAPRKQVGGFTPDRQELNHRLRNRTVLTARDNRCPLTGFNLNPTRAHPACLACLYFRSRCCAPAMSASACS